MPNKAIDGGVQVIQHNNFRGGVARNELDNGSLATQVAVRTVVDARRRGNVAFIGTAT